MPSLRRPRTRMVTCLLGGAVALWCATPSAVAAETLFLETRGVAGAAVVGPVASSAPLAAGAQYYAVVTGTSSIHKVSDWLTTKNVPCGLPEEAPIFGTPGVTNGVVGMDAETGFGVPAYSPFHGYKCTPTSFPFHITQYTDGGLQFSQGGRFGKVDPIGGKRSVPRADHTYTYPFTGNGEKLFARWVDKPLQDNYGRYRIQILDAAECAAITCVAAAQTSNDQTVGAGTIVRPVASGATATTRACISRRYFTVRLKKFRGVTITGAVIFVRGRSYGMRKRDDGRFVFKVDLRGLKRGQFSVRIVGRTSRGQILNDLRVYKTCRVKRI